MTPHDADLLSEERKNAKLTHEEIEIEELCELERYLDLVNEESDLNQGTRTFSLNKNYLLYKFVVFN